MARRPTKTATARSPKRVTSPPVTARSIGDSLINVVAGMGTDRDKMTSTMFAFDSMDRTQLDSAYRSDWIARKVVDIPADDATREWRAWQAGATDITALETLENDLQIRSKVRSAMLRGRLYGGGALVLGVNQGKPDEPLVLDRVRKGDLKWVHVVSRYDLTSGPIEWDVESPYCGQPKYYSRSATGQPTVNVHPSRIIRFVGNEILDPTLAQGWGDSILQVVADAVRSAGTVSNVVAQLVFESKTDVVKIPEMSERIKNKEYEDRLRKRFALAGLMKSSFSTLLIDKEEEWTRLTQSFTGLPDILKMYLLIASGAADIPATRMLSQSPTGLSSTGEADLRNYYDNVASVQENDITPVLNPLDEILIRSALGARPEDLFYEWNSLWQMSDVEKATYEKSRADTFKVDVDAGLIDPVVLKRARQNQLIESGFYPGLEQIIEEVDGEFDDIDEFATPQIEEKNDPDQVTDAKPRALYVRRDVLNGEAIRAHYAGQGIDNLIPAGDMHVTIIYTLNPVDWMKAEPETWQEDERGGLLVKAGGPRLHDVFGPGGQSRAIVLMFNSSALSYRHVRLREELDASVSYQDYQPHVTLAYEGNEGLNVDSLTPWTGPIELGPEVFEDAD